MNILKYRNLFFAFSFFLVACGIFAFYMWGVKLGIDFAGGTIWEFKMPAEVERTDLVNVFESQSVDVSSIAKTGSESFIVRFAAREGEIESVRQVLSQSWGEFEELKLETVGPTISKELAQNALKAVVFAIAAIVVYVTWAFRKVKAPASPLAFGVCTIVALFHDVLVLVGAFALLGRFWQLEIDSLFITALLTVLGFSVHDTIVVFDRVRENLKRSSETFEETVNSSLVQTMARSLNTSLTLIFVLTALLLFGGESIKTFVLALLIGVVSGTYSSIFIAAPLLVVWHNFKRRIKAN